MGVDTSRRLILASASPRRQELLRLLGIVFDVRPAAVEERRRPNEPPAALATRLSREKARAVAREEQGLVLAADTVVALDGQVLGKPRTAAEARTMLQALRGRWHTVYTGVTLVAAWQEDETSWKEHTFVDAARVHMRSYTDAEIEAYLASGDPFDKAGAYAIQHPDFRPVDAVDGCWATVMGLPVARVLDLLARYGLRPARPPYAACVRLFGRCCLLPATASPAPPPAV